MEQVMSSRGVAGEAGRKWTEWPGWDYVPGIAFIAIGAFALTQPPLTSVAASIAFGAMLAVAGAFSLVGGLVNIRHRGGWLVALLGVLSIVAGLLLLYYPLAGAVSLTWLIGAWLLVGAAVEFSIALTVPVGRLWLLLVGLVDLALGLLVLMMNPVEAFVFFGYYVGISLIARGLWSVMFTVDFHTLERKAEAVLG
jgi:uncharacterized membrane protein HdeD (DUF308 family)